MGIDHKILESRISNLCIKKGVSVNKMLREAGLTKSVMDNIKRQRTPSSETILAIATYFDVTTDYLLAKSDIPKAIHCDSIFALRSFESFCEELTRCKIIRGDRDLTAAQLDTALQALNSLINALAKQTESNLS